MATEVNQTGALNQTKHRWRQWMLVLSLVIAVAALQTYVVKRRLKPGAPVLRPTRFVQLTGSGESVVFSSDGKTLTVTGGGFSHDVDPATGQLLRSRKSAGEGDWMRTSSDGRSILRMRFVPKSKARFVALHDAGGEKILRRFPLTNDEHFVTAWPDNSRFIVSDQKRGGTRMVETATGRTLLTSPYYCGDLVTRFVNEKRWLLVGGYESSSNLLRADNLRPVYPQLKMPKLNHVRLSRDKRRIMGVEKNGTLHLWQLPECRHREVKTGLDGARWVFEDSGNALIVTGWKKGDKPNTYAPIVQVRSADGHQLTRELSGEPEGFSPNGRFLAFPRERGNFNGDWQQGFYEVSDTRTGKSMGRCAFNVDALGQPIADKGFLHPRCAIAPDGRYLAVTDETALVRIFDLKAPGHSTTSSVISTSAGRAADENGVRLFDEWRLAKNSGNRNPWYSGEYERNGKHFRLWNRVVSPDGRRVICALAGFKHAPNRPDGSLGGNATGERLIELRDAITGRVLHTLEDQRTSWFTFKWSLDSTLVAAGDDQGRVRWWDTQTGNVAGQLPSVRAGSGDKPILYLPTWFTTFAFSPDNRFLVVARRDGLIYLYSSQTCLPVAQLGKVSSPLLWIAFSADGRRVYGIPHDSAVKETRGFGVQEKDPELMSKEVLAWDVPKL